MPLLDIAEDFDALPLSASANPQRPDARPKTRFATGQRQFPPSHELTAGTNQILLATAAFDREPGVVLDYNAINSDTNDFTFQSGETYFISGWLNLGGITTLEGGAVLKYAEDQSGRLALNGQLICPPASAPPVVFTSMNDDAVGQTIEGSSGSPASWGYQAIALQAITNAIVVKNIRMRYAAICIENDSYDFPVEVWDSQFLDCGCVFDTYASSLGLNNVLFSHCDWVVGADAISEGELTIAGTHVTVDQCGSFILIQYGTTCYVNLTNSLFTEVSLVDDQSGSGMVYPVWQNSIQLTNETEIYQTAANANYYLAANSPYRNVGTTAIDADLLAELQTLTTYAPQDGGMPDTNAPDLGYHYPVNEDSDLDGLPDWWEWHWFGGYDHSGTDLDAKGIHNLRYDYQQGLNPKIGFNPVDSYYDFMHVSAFAPCPALSWGFDVTNYVQPSGPSLIAEQIVQGGRPDYYAWPGPNEINPDNKPMTFYRRRIVTEVYTGWIGSCDANGTFQGSLVTKTFTTTNQAYPYYRNPWNLDQVAVDAQADNVSPTGAKNLNALTDPSHSKDLRVTGYGLYFEVTTKTTFSASDNSGVADFLVLPTGYNGTDGNPLFFWDQQICPPPDVSHTSVTQHYRGAGEQPSQPWLGPLTSVKLASRRVDLEDAVTWADYMNQVESLLTNVSLTPRTLVNTREGPLYFDYFGLSAAYPNQNIVPSGASYDFDTKEYSFAVTPDQVYGIQFGPSEAGLPGSVISTPTFAAGDNDCASKSWQSYPYYWHPTNECDYYCNPISSPEWNNGNAANNGTDIPATCCFVSHDGNVTLHAGKSSEPAWQADKNYAAGDKVADANGHTEVCITSGHSSPETQPVWANTLGGVTQDNTVRWQAVQTPVTAIVSVGHGNQILVFPIKSGTIIANGYSAPVFPAANGPSSVLFRGFYGSSDFIKQKSRVRIPNHPESIMTDVANFLFMAPAIPTTNLLTYSINQYDLTDVTQNKYRDLPAGEYLFGPADIHTPTDYGYLMFDPSAAEGLVVDLDIDSENNNGLNPPARSPAEDQIEDDPNLPGKILCVDDGDTDGDGIPDFADGFDLDRIHGNNDDNAGNLHFVPLVIQVPAGINPDATKLRVNYIASTPAYTDEETLGPTYNPLLRAVKLLDNPQNGHFRPPTIRCKADFKDYCMFKPECGIYVNLGIVTWNCHGESPSSGVLTTNLIAGPFGPDNSDEFPEWSDLLPEGKGSKK